MEQQPDLTAIIAGAQAGDVTCFDTLIDAYSRRLYGYFYRLTGSVPDAEDLLQDTFVRLVKAIQRYDHLDRFDGFIFRIATNLYRDRLRRQQRNLETAPLSDDAEYNGSRSRPPDLADPSPTPPDRQLELGEQTQLLQDALDQIPQPEREVILLRHYSAMSFRDIAETMGTPLGTALARAHRGLNRLRQLMEGRQ